MTKLHLTTRHMSPAYFTDWEAEGSTGYSLSLDLGLSVGFLSMDMPIRNVTSGEKKLLSCKAGSVAAGTPSGAPFSIEVAPSALPSSGFGRIFALPGVKKPFAAAWFKGYAIISTVAVSTPAAKGMIAGPLGKAWTAVVFTDSLQSLLIDSGKQKALLGYKALCLLQGKQFQLPGGSFTCAGALVSVTAR